MLLNANTFSVKRSAMAADVMFNTNQHLFQNDIKTYIDEAFYAVQELTYNYPIKPKTFIFLVDTSLETVAAITHADAIVVQLNQTDKFTIQKTIIHELMHCILPNSNNWLNESAAEYLALKYMLKSALINESEFFLAISDKMKSADLVKSYSLLSLYNQSTPLQTKQNYLALYHKGAIWAFMLDLILNENANYRFGLEQFLIAEKSAENKIPAHLIPIYADFENKYIENNQGFSFNLFLNPVGILYEENKIQEIKAVQNINFLLKNGKMIILDNGGLNLLAENDIIISVDGMTRYEEIKKWLDNPTKKTAIFAIERDGEKKKINIDCQETLMVRLRFKLSFLEEKTTEQQTNWLEYLN
jgi:hypothetical protein